MQANTASTTKALNPDRVLEFALYTIEQELQQLARQYAPRL
jgi:hypothetical protein